MKPRQWSVPEEIIHILRQYPVPPPGYYGERVNQTIIQEVLPDTIQISREEFRDALVTFCNTLSFELIELKLFGPVTPGSR